MSLDSEIARLIRKLVEEVVEEQVAKAMGDTSSVDEFLSTASAAAMAQAHPGTIRRWIREGRLKAHRAGRHIRVKRSDLCALLTRLPANDEVTPEQRARNDFG